MLDKLHKEISLLEKEIKEIEEKLSDKEYELYQKLQEFARYKNLQKFFSCPVDYDINKCSSKEHHLTCETCYHTRREPL